MGVKVLNSSTARAQDIVIEHRKAASVFIITEHNDSYQPPIGFL
jgi:hypothetical protein